MKHLSKISKSVLMLALAFFMGAFVAQAAGVPEYAMHTGTALVALSFIPQGDAVGQFRAIVVADIITEFGAYYKAGGQNIKDLVMKFLVKSETENIFKRRITEDTKKQGATAEFSEVLQSYQNQWTPKVDVTFKPLAQELFRLKIDAESYPDDLHETWLAFLTDNNLDRKTWPFVRWWVEGIIAKSHEDYETKEVFKGVFVAPTPGVAGITGQSVDGLKVQFQRLNADGLGNTLALGAVPTDPIDFVDYMEQMDSYISEDNETLFGNIDAYYMSKALVKRFRTGMRKKYNDNYAQADIATLIDSDKPLIGLNSHSGSTKIWATPAINRIQYVKAPANENIMRVENVDRKVKAYTDYWKSVGFWVPDWVYQNDVELTTTP